MLRKTYNYCGTSLEFWKGIPVGCGTLVFSYVTNLSREPILDLRMSGKMGDYIGQGYGYGVVAGKVEDENITIYLCLCQSV
jgi:hypothetical protein